MKNKNVVTFEISNIIITKIQLPKDNIEVAW